MSFFHQPALETKLRSLFDSSPVAPPRCNDVDGEYISDVVTACMLGGPCARLICGAEVREVRVGDDGAISLSVECLAPPCTQTTISCRCSTVCKAFLSCTKNISRRFLLAADGASSSVRKQFNAAYAGTSAASQWFIVDAVAASAEAEAQLLQRWPNFNFCCGCDIVFVHARTPSCPAHHRWEFLLQPNGGTASAAALLRSVGVDVSLVRVIREVQPAFCPTCALFDPHIRFSTRSTVAPHLNGCFGAESLSSATLPTACHRSGRKASQPVSTTHVIFAGRSSAC